MPRTRPQRFAIESKHREHEEVATLVVWRRDSRNPKAAPRGGAPRITSNELEVLVEAGARQFEEIPSNRSRLGPSRTVARDRLRSCVPETDESSGGAGADHLKTRLFFGRAHWLALPAEETERRREDPELAELASRELVGHLLDALVDELPTEKRQRHDERHGRRRLREGEEDP